MGDGEYLVILPEHQFPVDGALLVPDGLHGVLFDFPEHAVRRFQTALFTEQKLDAEIHLQKGEPHVHPGLQRAAHVETGVPALDVRIAVDPDPVAVFPAEKLPDRHAVRFPDDVPEGDLNAGYAASLS